MSDITDTVRKAIKDDKMEGLLVSLGLAESNVQSESVEPTSGIHAQLLSEWNEDFKFGAVLDFLIESDMGLHFSSLKEMYKPNKRKVTLYRERTYEPHSIKTYSAEGKKAVPLLESLRFSKKGVEATFAYVVNPRTTNRIRTQLKSEDENLRRSTESELLRLPANATTYQKVQVVYNQVLTYQPSST